MLKTRHIGLSFFLVLSLFYSEVSSENPSTADSFITIDTLSAQQKTPKKDITSWLKKMHYIKRAKTLSENRKYDQAIKKGIKAVEIDTSFYKSNFRVGFIYFESPYEKTKSIPYLERALRHYTKRDTLGEIFYYQGKAYQLNGQIDQSLVSYTNYLRMLEKYGTTYLNSGEQNELKTDILIDIQMCKNAKILLETPAKEIEFNGITDQFHISLVEDSINSPFDDYSNILSPNDSLLFFTSRRKGYSGTKLDFWDDKYFEDIYFSKWDKNGWTSAKAMDKTINTKDHDASNSLSSDGKILYIYRGPDQGSFYRSDFIDSRWNTPIRLSYNSDTTINSKGWETSLNIDRSGDTIYLASDREDGFGDRDLYWTTQKSDGTFGKLNNLGDSINTSFDEDAPFISANGKTLYFSSRGHNSMGGFDIFKSEKTANGWSTPVNMGYPINSTCDDIYFTISHNGNLAYFSSSRVVNGRNDFNIYNIRHGCDTIRKATIDGYVYSNEKLKNASITITELYTQQQYGPYAIDSNGKYTFSLYTAKTYLLNFNADNYQSATEKIMLPNQCDEYNIYQKIEARQVTDTTASKIYQTVTFKNAFLNLKEKTRKITSEKEHLKLFDNYLDKKDITSINTYSETNRIDTIRIKKPEIIKADTTATDSISIIITDTTTIATISAAPVTADTVTTSTPPQESSLKNILFAFNSYTVKREYLPELKELAKFLSKNQNMILEIKGHTDTKGSTTYNLSLSKKRATAVSNYLKKQGVNKKYLSIKYSGENEPVSIETNDDGSDNQQARMMNRRVELKLIPLK